MQIDLACANQKRGLLYSACFTEYLSEDAERILQKGIVEGEIFSESVSLDDLITGQSAVRWKREILSYRLYLLTERGEVVPKKRVHVRAFSKYI